MSFVVRDVRCVLYACPVDHSVGLLTANAATMEVTVRSAPSTSSSSATAAAETFTFDAIQYAPWKTALYTSALANTVRQQFVGPLVQSSMGAARGPGMQCLTIVQGGPAEHTTETFRLLAASLLEDAPYLIGDYGSHRFRVECAAVAHSPAAVVDLLQSSSHVISEHVDNPWDVAVRRALPADKPALAIQDLLQHIAPATPALKGMRQLRVTLVDTRTGQDMTSHTLCLCPSMDELCASFLEDAVSLRQNLLVARHGNCADTLLQQSILAGITPVDSAGDKRIVDQLVVVSCVMDSGTTQDNRPVGMTGHALRETCQFGAATTATVSSSSSWPSAPRRVPTSAATTTAAAAEAEDPVDSPAIGRVEKAWQTRAEALAHRANAASQAAQQRLDDAQQQERDAARLSAALQEKTARMRDAYHLEETRTAAQIDEARQLLSDYEHQLDDFQGRLREAHRRALAAERDAEKTEARREGFQSQMQHAERQLAGRLRDAHVAAERLLLDEEQAARLTVSQAEASLRQALALQREQVRTQSYYADYVRDLKDKTATAAAELEQLHDRRDQMALQELVTMGALDLLTRHSELWADGLVRRQAAFSAAAAEALRATDTWAARAAAVRTEMEEAAQLLDAMRDEMQQTLDAKAQANASAASERERVVEALHQLHREKDAAAQRLDALNQSITESAEKYAQLLHNKERAEADMAATEATRNDLVRATHAAQKLYADTLWLLGERERELVDVQGRGEAAAQALDDALADVRARIEAATEAAQTQQREADAQEERRRRLEDAVAALLEHQRQAEAAAAAIGSVEYQSAQSLFTEARRREAAVAASLQSLLAFLGGEEATARRQLQRTEAEARDALHVNATSAQVSWHAAVVACAMAEVCDRSRLEEAERVAFTDLLLHFCVPHVEREASEAVLAGNAARALAATQADKAALEEEVDGLVASIQDLQEAKEAIEETIAEVIRALEEATGEMEGQEDAVQAEAAYSERLIRVAETDAATRFDSILGRCTELISQSRRRQSSIASMGTSSLSAHPGVTPFTFPSVGPSHAATPATNE